ncbi:MAG TPA: SRPBCC family protein [Actinomycetota bacterium]
MGHVSIDLEVDAPPEEAWKVVSDPRNLPRWDRHIISVRGVPEDGLKVGAKYVTEMRMFRVTGKVEAEVLEIEAPRYSRIRLRGLLDATVQTTITPISGGSRSLLEHDIEYHFRGGGLAAFATQGLAATGGPAIVLRKGTLAQKRQIEQSSKRG